MIVLNERKYSFCNLFSQSYHGSAGHPLMGARQPVSSYVQDSLQTQGLDFAVTVVGGVAVGGLAVGGLAVGGF